MGRKKKVSFIIIRCSCLFLLFARNINKLFRGVETGGEGGGP